MKIKENTLRRLYRELVIRNAEDFPKKDIVKALELADEEIRELWSAIKQTGD